MKPSIVLIAIAAIAGNTLAAPAGTCMAQTQQRDMALQASHIQLGERSIQMSDALPEDMAKRDATSSLTHGLLFAALFNALKTKLLDAKAVLDELKMGKEDLVRKLLQALGVAPNQPGTSKSLDTIKNILSDGRNGSHVPARGV